MPHTLIKTFRFEAAHMLPNAGDGHKCTSVHGHNYRVELVLQGKLAKHEGWVVDFAEVEDAWTHACFSQLDHQLLNSVIANPTAENLAEWIYEHMHQVVIGLRQVTVWENDDSAACYKP